MSGFRKHVHKLSGTTATQAGHHHKVSVITGPPWPGAGGHIHRIIGATETGKSPHVHQMKGWTGPSMTTGAEHTHSVDISTKETQAHAHTVTGTTAAFAPSRSAALAARTTDGVFGK
ncbi:MAG TPA: hypothetical protein PLM74_08815 [Bacillota bacterium]|nr:hypothetical protein [Bacillota bacterium]